MKWDKLGQIFKTDDYGLYYAKSPQAIVFQNFIRIYFSTCIYDGKKLISEVRFVDYDKKFRSILNISKNTVIERGNLGCYDEHGIFPFSPFKHGDLFYAYISGWTRRVSVSADSGIGLAISEDAGNTFKRLGEGPILASSLNEPYLVIDGYVKKYDDNFHMWYIYGTSWTRLDVSQEPERTYKIGHAISKDGIDWVKEGKQIIIDKLDNECQALPTVIKKNDRYHMFFCYRNTFDFRRSSKNSYHLGYAYSDELKKWTRDDEKIGIDVSANSWDSDMICYPNVFEVDNDIYMLYNGNEFGKYGFGLAKLKGEF